MVAWTVLIHPAVEKWRVALDESSRRQLAAALDVLAADGPSLGRPFVDTIHGARHANLKELRPGSAGRSEIRVLFAFDPARQAILLVGGDKAEQWDKWYRHAIPLADDRLDEHTTNLRRRS
jgi:hypothetical protein